MMGSTVDAFDDRIGRAPQLIVEASRDEPSEDWGGRFVTVKGEPGDIWVAAGAGHGAMHGLDDVAARSKIAQSLLEARLQHPARRPDLFREAEPLELRRASEHQAPQPGALIR